MTTAGRTPTSPAASSFLNVCICDLRLHALRQRQLGPDVHSIPGIGVFCEERTLFEDALRFVAAGAGNGSVRGGSSPTRPGPQGAGPTSSSPSAWMGDAAQVAWDQGVDLWGFDHNDLANAEDAAEYNLGGDVPFTPDPPSTSRRPSSAIGRGTLPPIYEMTTPTGRPRPRHPVAQGRPRLLRGVGRVAPGSNDEAQLRHLRLRGRQRPGGDRATAPAGVTAVGDGTNVVVVWLPSVSATTQSVRRATRPEGATRRSRRPSTAQTRTTRGGGGPLTTPSPPPTPRKPVPNSSLAAALRRSPRSTQDARIPGSAAFELNGLCGASDRGGTHRLTRSPPGIVLPQLPVRQDRRHAARLPRRGRPHARRDPGGCRCTPGAECGPMLPRRGATSPPPTQPRRPPSSNYSAAFPISSLSRGDPASGPVRRGRGRRLPVVGAVLGARDARGRRCRWAVYPDGIAGTEVGATGGQRLGRTASPGWSSSARRRTRTTRRTARSLRQRQSSSAYTASSGPCHAPHGGRPQGGIRRRCSQWPGPIRTSPPGNRLRAPRTAHCNETIATGVGPVGFGARARPVRRRPPAAPGTRTHYVVVKTSCGGRGPLVGVRLAAMPRPMVPQLHRGVSFIRGARTAAVRFAADRLPTSGLRRQAHGSSPERPPRLASSRSRPARATRPATATEGSLSRSQAPPPAPWRRDDLGDPVSTTGAFGALGAAGHSHAGQDVVDRRDRLHRARYGRRPDRQQPGDIRGSSYGETSRAVTSQSPVTGRRTNCPVIPWLLTVRSTPAPRTVKVPSSYDGAAGRADRHHAQGPEGAVVEDHVAEVAVRPGGGRRCADGEGERAGRVARRVARAGRDRELAGLGGCSGDQAGALVDAEAVGEPVGGEPYGLVRGPQKVAEGDALVRERRGGGGELGRRGGRHPRGGGRRSGPRPPLLVFATT